MTYNIRGTFVHRNMACYSGIPATPKFGYGANIHHTSDWAFEGREIPVGGRLGKVPKNVPDIGTMTEIYVLNQKVKDIIESFEPNVHHFHPIYLQRNDGTPIGQGYLLDCAQTCLPYCNDKDGKFNNGIPGIIPVDRKVSEGSPFFFEPWMGFSKKDIEGKHLWRGKPTKQHYFFTSDELGAALIKAKIKGLKFQKLTDFEV